jgi:molybdopterin synthase catalytic subunit
MHVLAVVGSPEAGRTTLVERLIERLSERGRVGTIEHVTGGPDLDTDGRDTTRYRDGGATRGYVIGDSEWFAAGEECSLRGALDDLARTCDYGLVEGGADARLPKVVLGDREVTGGDVLARADTAADVDLPAVLEAVEGAEPYETLGSLVARAKTSPQSERAGAIATFTGRVRAKDSPDDNPTEYLEFEKYDGVAAGKMADIREELEARDGVYEVLLHHRTGVVEAGEDIVFVVVLAGHRAEAFETVEDGINRLKADVPLFKKEVTVSEEFWAHEH